jgi:uncharacterized protein (DUF362 family)
MKHLLDRRQLLGSAAMLGATALTAQDAGSAPAVADKSYHLTTPIYKIVSSYKPEGKLGAPGLFPGKVAEVKSEQSISTETDRVDRAVLHKMVERGMTSLTGAPDLVSSWKTFFEPGDRVAIKVNASGAPQCISSPELVQEVVAGLIASGVKTKDIWLYERYAGQMDLVGYESFLPDGVRVWSGERRRGELAGYDRDVYVEVDFQGEEDQRSFLWEVVSKHVNKIVNIPNIKDHASAGATGCLKNIGYGSFSNVARSHSLKAPMTHTRTFIGTLNSVEPLRSRTVLHIMDGLRGVWHGGPAAFTPKFLWYPKLLQFGTDPVAMDRIELDIVDGKRKEMGAVSIFNRDPQFLGQTRANPRVMVRYREPEHVQYASGLGLGVADIAKIKYAKFNV